MKQRLPEAGPSMDIPRINAAAELLPLLSMSAVLVEYIKTYYNLDRL